MSLWNRLCSLYVHFYTLTLFEIFFYFFFVVSYEKRIIAKLVANLVSSGEKAEERRQHTIMPFRNETLTVLSFAQPDYCNTIQQNMDEKNRVLQTRVFYYVYISSFAFVFLFVLDCRRERQRQRLQLESMQPATMNVLVVAANDAESHMVQCHEENQTTSRHLTRWYSETYFLKEIKNTFLFIVLMSLFEYVFFVFVVEKYQIANADSIMCNYLF